MSPILSRPRSIGFSKLLIFSSSECLAITDKRFSLVILVQVQPPTELGLHIVTLATGKKAAPNCGLWTQLLQPIECALTIVGADLSLFTDDSQHTFDITDDSANNSAYGSPHTHMKS